MAIKMDREKKGTHSLILTADPVKQLGEMWAPKWSCTSLRTF